MGGRALICALFLLGCVRPPSASGPEALVSLIEAAAAGRLPPGEYHGISPGDAAASSAFVYVEAWLNVNGEAVHDVRPRAPSAEGDFRFTASRDGRHVYLIAYGWPGPQVRTAAVRAVPGMKVTMLGWPDELPWERLGSLVVVATPREMADEENHPCRQAFVFRFSFP
ncbi:MAG: alpha-L-fucosidase C-terminal domain-containing protein [Opitutales bacterium]